MMLSKPTILVFAIFGGAVVSGLTCLKLTEHSTVEERYIAWVCEQIVWKNALAHWKETVEQNCDITDAEEYWNDAFNCPDFSGITCSVEASLDHVTDSFNCSITMCNDGKYKNKTAFQDIWSHYLNTHQTLMTIYKSKLINCKENKCLNSDAITLEAWNSHNMKYFNLSIQLEEASERMRAIEGSVTAQIQETDEMMNLLTDSNSKISNLENDLIAQTQKSNELSRALNESNAKIADLENDVIDLTQRSSELTSALDGANANITELESSVLGYCPLRYNGMCFWVEILDDNVNLTQASQICASQGGRLANIYSKAHYYMMTGYLRMFASNSDANFPAWVGMTYNKEENAVYLSDNTIAPFARWRPGQPNLSYCCNVYLFVRDAVNDSDQHMGIGLQSFGFRGVFCEK